MCGIAGIIGLHPESGREHVRRMCDAMIHRGPDASGIFTAPHVTLGHRRLKVIELTDAGSQPMTDKSGRFTIVFNGEIYNFRRLRQQLAALGHSFGGGSDTEVLLTAYAHYGENCLTHIEGMFAFAVYDAQHQSVFLARDPMGIKPLYVAELPDAILFASEVTALMASGLIPREIDPASVGQTLMMGAPFGGTTPLKHVCFLRAGEYLSIQDRSIVCRRVWRRPASDPPGPATAEMLNEVTQQVVREHLVSDVPIAILLSGGVDSSALLALVRQASNANLHAFTLGFEEEHLDESAQARVIARNLNVEHTVVTVSSQELLGYVDGFLARMDLPILDGFNVFSICRIVQQSGFVVLLSGQGGDEVFGGYDSFRALPDLWRILAFLRYVPSIFRKQLGKLVNYHANRFGRAAKLEEIVGRGVPWVDSYMRYRSIFPARVLAEILQPPVFSDVVDRASRFAHQFEQEWQPENVIARVSDLESGIYMHDTLLRVSDVNSMAHSIELRVPYVDRRIHSCVRRFPPDKRMDPNIRKPLLSNLVADQLPATTYRTAKSGFHLPVGRMLTGSMREPFLEMLDSSEVYPSHIFRVAALRKLFAGLDACPDSLPHSHAVWALFVFGHWMQRMLRSGMTA